MAVAIRRISPRFLQNVHRFVRPLSSVPSSCGVVPTVSFDDKEEPTIKSSLIGPCSAADSILNFNNVKDLFLSVPTSNLARSSLTLKLAAVEPVVDMGIWVMNSRFMETPLLREIILGLVKATFFKHFCAGSDLAEVSRSVKELRDSGLRGMLDYGLEHADDNQSCDRNMNEFIKTVKSTESLPTSSVSFLVVKITAICPVSLLKRVSDNLRWEYKDKSFHLPWKVNTLPLFAESSPFYHTPEKPEPLTAEEEQDLQLAHQRLDRICKQCLENNVPVLIDAEDTSINPAIDYLTYSAAITHNKDDNPIIYGTIQTYLKDAKERLLLAKEAAERIQLPMGVKLVRGAYMSSERKLAASLGVESPIYNNIEETHSCFDACAAYMLEEIANGSGAVVLATHNIESGKLAAVKARYLGIAKENQKLQFAQLYGMADALSFGLSNAGFQVSKYMPFGPVEQVIPYLLRRAEENRGLLSSSSLDRQLMWKELKRRALESSFISGKELKPRAQATIS